MSYRKSKLYPLVDKNRLNVPQEYNDFRHGPNDLSDSNDNVDQCETGVDANEVPQSECASQSRQIPPQIPRVEAQSISAPLRKRDSTIRRRAPVCGKVALVQTQRSQTPADNLNAKPILSVLSKVRLSSKSFSAQSTFRSTNFRHVTKRKSASLDSITLDTPDPITDQPPSELTCDGKSAWMDSVNVIIPGVVSAKVESYLSQIQDYGSQTVPHIKSTKKNPILINKATKPFSNADFLSELKTKIQEKSLLSVPVESLYTSKSANSSPILLRKSENLRDDNNRTHSLLDTTLFLQNVDSANLANNLIIIKEGELEKSKIVELNKKPKKWILNAYGCLTKRSFYLFESKTIFELLKSGRKDKGSFIIKIDVKSCEIKTKSEFRKNTLIIIDTKTGSQVLIQNDKSKQVEEWQSAILQTSSMGMEERPKTLLGLESTQILANAKDQTKIRNKLKHFFGGGRPSIEDLTKASSPSRENLIFGGELEKMCEMIEERPKVPYFVRRCIQVIEPYIGTDGLYRASGNSTQIQKIRSEINQHNYDILDANIFDVHVLTGALKLFFRELKVTLIPNSEYAKCLQMSEEKDKGTIASELKKSLLEFPISHQDTLKFLMHHLLEVSKHERENRMDISNLATIWAPNLLQTGVENIDPKYDAFYQCSLQMRIIQIYLTNFSNIFGDI